MLSSFSEKAIMTKVKAMYGDRITDMQYRELLHRRSVAEIISYLRDETAYRDVLTDAVPNAVHRTQLENLLRKHRYAQYLKLLRYDFSRKESFYHFPIMRAEVEQLLQMILLLNFGKAEEYNAQYPSYLSSVMSFSLQELARVRSFDELRALFKDTAYAPLLNSCIPEGAQEVELAKCENVLYSYFYTHIAQLASDLYNRKTAARLHEIHDTHTELLNISLIYRMKKYYPSTSAEEIQALMLPDNDRIPKKTMKDWIASPDADEFLRKLSSSPYGQYTGSQDFVFIEYTGECIRYHLNRRYLRFAESAPTAFTAYIVLSELELKNITTIIEGIRYSVPSDEIQKLLIV